MLWGNLSPFGDSSVPLWLKSVCRSGTQGWGYLMASGKRTEIYKRLQSRAGERLPTHCFLSGLSWRDTALSGRRAWPPYP